MNGEKEGMQEFRINTGNTLRKGIGVLMAAFLISHFPFLISSCSSIDCPVQNTVYSSYALYTADEQVDTLRDTMYVFSRRAAGKDTLLFNAGIGLTKFQLQISYSHPEDTLCFLMVNGSNYLAIDTVFVKKEDIPHFESVDCSASFFHRLTAVRSTHHAIDTIVISKNFVDYDATTPHFHLVLKHHD
jgi:hypothetical protein